LIGEIVHEIDSDRIMFDAPNKHQQVWFVRRFGADVNLGNIAVADVLSLETLRLGLRSDTLATGRSG
jgi:phosphosulfolactate synthase